MLDISKIPAEPGCYLYKNAEGTIIYVGKAKNLKKRVANYFQKSDHDAKTKALVSHIADIDFLVTKTEIEALILENNLIKKHSPRYNIDWKDSKRYASIEKTDEEYPRFIVARKKNTEGKLFGPFTSGQSRDYILETINRTFKLRTCQKLPKRACLRYQLGICTAPCINNVSIEEYLTQVKNAELVLSGKIEVVVEDLKEKMKSCAEKKEFERALAMRNQIHALTLLKEKQTMERNKKYDEDIINYIIKENTVYLMLFNVYKGTLENKTEFEFEHDESFLEQFIIAHYEENQIPNRIILPKSLDQELEKFLSQKRGSKVVFENPKSGEKKQLLDLVEKNIELAFFGDLEKLEDLKKRINLQETPKVIECFDISHLHGTATVASMVQFRNGRPDKANYRKFKIKTVSYIDDFASMKEVVERRYLHLQREKGDFPNLIVIDGGIGQLNAAREVLEKIGVSIPIIALAKQFEEIYIPGRTEPLRLDKKTLALKLLQHIRDEAHRFAIKYNRLLRKKKLTE